MTISEPDPAGTTPPVPADGDVKGRAHAYAWYDPDATAFDRSDQWRELDLSEDDETPAVEYG
jgi:hypothetical protein